MTIFSDLKSMLETLSFLFNIHKSSYLMLYIKDWNQCQRIRY